MQSKTIVAKKEILDRKAIRRHRAYCHLYFDCRWQNYDEKSVQGLITHNEHKNETELRILQTD